MNIADRELVARAAQLSEHLDTTVRLYGRIEDLGALPGPAGLRALGDGLAQLAADLQHRADQLEGGLPAPQPMVLDVSTDRGSASRSADLTESRGASRDAGPALPIAPQG